MPIKTVTVHFNPYHYKSKNERENTVIYEVYTKFFKRCYNIYHN